MPIGAIANPHPIVLIDLAPEKLKRAVDDHPYAYFPLVSEGHLKGIIGRKDILSALTAGVLPEIIPAVTCYPEQTVREIGNKFIESPSNIVVVMDRESENVTGIITLHDLLRAQAAIQS